MTDLKDQSISVSDDDMFKKIGQLIMVNERLSQIKIELEQKILKLENELIAKPKK